MQIGNLNFDTDLIQAPLAGISCAPFRVIAHQIGRPAYCVSEMVSAYELTQTCKRNNVKFKRYIYKDPAEGVLCTQVSGNNPHILADAACIAVELGANMIDLNCGCPKKKIRKKKCGSKHLAAEYLDNLYECVLKMRQALGAGEGSIAPLTVKIRLSENSESESESESEGDIKRARLLQSAGADAIIVHGRTWKDEYDNSTVDYKRINSIVNCVDIPVIGNGDVKDIVSLKQMRNTGCAGVMIARASIGNPWIFNVLRKESKSGVNEADPENIEKVFKQHYDALVDLEGGEKAAGPMFRLKRHYFKIV